ncbi:MAG TPA: hypothetical protein VMV69_00720 [Pirellulales bacterium]|nr:hypothetical protein [Pirellulales bacterium]
MSITFQCTNGHKLNCPETLAGKPGKCPKCGAVFRVPQPPAAPAASDSSPNPFSFLSQEGDENEADSAASDDQEPEPAEEQEAPAREDELQIGEGPAGADEIVFLCPNGHRLHGPASLVGRPGQCPHCQVRFLIPSPEDVPDDDEAEQDESISLDEILIHIDTSSKGSSLGGASGSKPSAAPPSATSHPLAALLTRLWAARTANSSIELHLGDGKLIVPDEFAKQDPVANYGLFAMREANGSHTLTAVSWDSIERITVRGLAQLPKEWFDGK